MPGRSRGGDVPPRGAPGGSHPCERVPSTQRCQGWVCKASRECEVWTWQSHAQGAAFWGLWASRGHARPRWGFGHRPALSSAGCTGQAARPDCKWALAKGSLRGVTSPWQLCWELPALAEHRPQEKLHSAGGCIVPVCVLPTARPRWVLQLLVSVVATGERGWGCEGWHLVGWDWSIAPAGCTGTGCTARSPTVPCQPGHAMLCHAELCQALPCRVAPCHATPCRAVPCCAKQCHAELRHAVPCQAVPCQAVPYHAMPSCAKQCHSELHYAMPHRAKPCRSEPCHAKACQAMPCHAMPSCALPYCAVLCQAMPY